MSTHTPGEWTVYAGHEYPGIEAKGVDCDDHEFTVVVFGDAEEIRRDYGGIRGRDPEEALANARLIAAAPMLLLALYAFVEDHEGFSDEELRRRGRLLMNGTDMERVIFARAAIARAEPGDAT